MQEILVAPCGDPQGQRRLHLSPNNKSSPRPMKTCSSPPLKVRPHPSQPQPLFSRRGFSNFGTVDTVSQITLHCGGLSRALPRVSHITSPYILNASSSPLLPPAVTTRNTSKYGQMSQAGDSGERQSPCLVENHCCKDSLWTEGGPWVSPRPIPHLRTFS